MALTLKYIRDLSQRVWDMQLVEDVEDEAKRYGAMQELFVPQPPPTVGPDEPARVFIRFENAAPVTAAGPPC